MRTINNFFINKEKKSHQNCVLLKEFIEKFLDDGDLHISLHEFSKIIDIPLDSIKDKSKQLMLSKFNFKTGKFNSNYSVLKIFSNFLIFIFLTFSQIFNSKIFKKKNTQIVDVMLDNVTFTDEIYRFQSILEKYENNLVVLKKKINFNKKTFRNLNIINNKIFFNSSFFLKGKLKHLIIFGIKVFKISIKNKFDFFQIINVILNSSIRYQNLFEDYKVKFLLHDRSYTTCPIRNFLLKEKCNGTTGFVQVHLAESVISMFNFTDIIFTFGNEVNTKKKIQNLGGKVSFSYGVGSLKAEHLMDNNPNDFDSKFSSDILVIGVNITDWFYTSKDISRAYLDFLNYIKKLSLKFPSKKIIYKHHGNFKWNEYEKNLFKDTNIKMYIENSEIKNKADYISKVFLKRKLNFFNDKHSSKKDTKFDSFFSGSYSFLKSSKFVISFSSTMILEATILKKPAYFINPHGLESSYFQELDYLKDKIITNFLDLENKVLQCEKLETKENNNICLKGQSGHLIKKIIDKKLKEKINDD